MLLCTSQDLEYSARRMTRGEERLLDGAAYTLGDQLLGTGVSVW